MDKDNIQEGKVAELLKVRYKVIADYPFNPKDVGEIEEPFDEQSESFLKEYLTYLKNLNGGKIEKKRILNLSSQKLQGKF